METPAPRGVVFGRPDPPNNNDTRTRICLTALIHNYHRVQFNEMRLHWAPDRLITTDAERQRRARLKSLSNEEDRREARNFEALKWVLAFEDNVLIGFAGYNTTDAHTVTLVWLFVVPTQRHRNIGSTLLELCVTYGYTEENVTVVRTDCEPDVRMMRFFARRHGFSVCGPQLWVDEERRITLEEYMKVAAAGAAFGLAFPRPAIPADYDERVALAKEATAYVARTDSTDTEFHRRFKKLIVELTVEPCVWMERPITAEWIQAIIARPLGQLVLSAPHGGDPLFSVD
jgi:GNAT superfamily N-acetyltransferase